MGKCLVLALWVLYYVNFAELGLWTPWIKTQTLCTWECLAYDRSSNVLVVQVVKASPKSECQVLLIIYSIIHSTNINRGLSVCQALCLMLKSKAAVTELLFDRFHIKCHDMEKRGSGEKPHTCMADLWHEPRHYSEKLHSAEMQFIAGGTT